MKNPWSVFGAILAAVLVLAGLAFIAYVIFVFVAMANFGSNK